MSGQSASLPVAVVVAGGLIGAGLFFGLRSRPASPVASPSAPTNGPASADVPVPMAESQGSVMADVSKALRAQRPRIVAECWEPAAKRQPEPAVMKIVYSFSFDAQGQQLARGISVERSTARADVTSCLSTALHPLTIPPPGAPMSVDVPFALP